MQHSNGLLSYHPLTDLGELAKSSVGTCLCQRLRTFRRERELC